MGRKPFRTFKIVRNCDKQYSQHSSYRQYLKTDFHNRCAYCNLIDSAITTPFEIDHYIPRNAFEHKRDELDHCYDNLIYACKKCNDAKGSQFEGDIFASPLDNKLFYDPVKIDYNSIFYRNEYGGIASDDPKGIKMIQYLKLYRPIHNLAWLCEQLQNIQNKLKMKIADETQREKKEILEKAKSEIDAYYCTCKDIFIANYNNNDFKLDL